VKIEISDDRYRDWVTEDYEHQIWYAALIAAGAWGYYLGSAAEHAWHFKETITIMNLIQFATFLALLGGVSWLAKRS
jgi:hypothetical protein